ncbi:Hypothetical protein CINCED_3A016838 [Cinara cedri]|uniref:Uncharacterized protein n=1 Tax=Cinara cedri TaxID=506608 RepID=A0A5E4MU31_9HEMI|nr:Hypothetical protein CINCED_3A016838 [Cinara cedri]
MILTGMLTVCLVWPATIRAFNFMDQYGKNQLMQKQNRHNSPAWYNDVNLVPDWASPYSIADGGNDGLMMGNYGRRLGDNGGMMMDNDGTAAFNQQNNNMLSSDDYYYDDTADVGPYGSSRPQPHDRLDYAVVRYPSYHGYYPVDDDLRVAGYDRGASDNQLLQYENRKTFDNRKSVPVVPPAAVVSSAMSPYYTPPVHASGVINGYAAPLPPITLNRGYDTPRFPMDKLHRFRKVFLSNVVSPTNVFKSPEEQQLFDIWESLINDDLMTGNVQQTMDDNRIITADRRVQAVDQDRQQFPLFQHLPPVLQRFQKQQQRSQKLKQRHQDQYHHKLQQLQPQAQKLVQYQKPNEERKSYPSMQSHKLKSEEREYREWTNGSPLRKRSSSAAGGDEYGAAQLRRATPADNDDVRQLEKLKTSKTVTGNMIAKPNRTVSSTTVVTTTTIAMTDTTPPPPMTDGGQREYVLPRPAGEKSGLESLFEVIAEGGIRGNYNGNGAADSAFSKLREEVKVNKKRSFVSDETSLAAELGALRKN